MKRKLSKSGNGWSVFLPKVIIELLEINPNEDEIEMNIENKVLTIKRCEKEKSN